MLVMFLVIALVLLVGSVTFNVFLVKKNFQLSDQREDLVDKIEESLDVLDDSYQRITRLVDTPVFSDEPVVRDVVAEIRRAKNVVLAVASLVVTYGSESENNTANR